MILFKQFINVSYKIQPYINKCITYNTTNKGYCITYIRSRITFKNTLYYNVFMDVLTVRLDDNISKKIEVILKEFNYSTKTDFVREAIRTKVIEMEEQRTKKEALKNLEKYFGSVKTGKTIEETNVLIRQAGEEFVKEFAKKHDLE